MYPVLTKELSEAYYKAMSGFVIRIEFDTKRIGAGQNETISCEFRWVCAAAGEAILGDCTVIDFKCGVAMRRGVLISEINLTELESSNIGVWLCTSIVIGFPQA